MHKVIPFAATSAIAAPIALFALLLAAPSLDPLLMDPAFHFWVVSGTALAAVAACALVVLPARTLRETRLLFLAIAFIAIAGIFSVHGLMTPGTLVHDFRTSLPTSAWISLAAGSVFVALSAMETPRWLDTTVQRAGAAIFAWALMAIGAYIMLSFAVAHWLDWVPADERRIQYIIATSALALYAFAAWRYYQAYLFTRLPSQLAMTVSMLLLCQVPPILLWGQVWYLSWWLYHMLYASAFLVLMAGWAIEAQRAGSLKVIAEGLSMRDALAQLNRGHGAHVLELVDAIEAKDVATLGHVRRVSTYALAIGRRLALSQAELRSLALAAEMHDVGKIGVPDAILSKPGALTEDEFAEMRRHTGRGGDIARRVTALRELAPIIRAHHERMNGRGYPDGLAGEEIPMLARIIAVADTYDAMTSARPYRSAMSAAAAVAELERVRGDELDPRCVDTFLAWLAGEQRAAA